MRHRGPSPYYFICYTLEMFPDQFLKSGHVLCYVATSSREQMDNLYN
jgi:hypothetical protein